MSGDELVEREEGAVHRLLLDLETYPVHYTRSALNFTCDSRPKQIGPTSAEEIAVHFWRDELRHSDMLEHSNRQTA